MPHLAQQDDRRPVGATARRARLLSAQIAPGSPQIAGESRRAVPAPAPAEPSAARPEARETKGRLFVITGPSGVGKGTLIKLLLERVPDLDLSVSATTRPPRPGERDGVDYHFLDENEFDRRLASSDFMEHATYSGHRYGTLRSEVEPPLERGISVVLEIEVQGARQVRARMPEAVLVFVSPPTPEDLRERLEGRGTDRPDQIGRRLVVAREELAAQREFRHVIVNDEVERAADELVGLVRGLR